MIFQELKTATAELHSTLEQLVGLPERLQTRQAYQTLLQQLWGLYVPLETQLLQFNHGLPIDFKERLKTPALRHDLLNLGMSESELAQVPLADQLPSLTSHADAVGCLYVLEGATLGGQLISRYVHNELGLDLQQVGHFYLGYGSETGSKWRAFKAAVEQQAWTPTDQERMIKTAQATFHAFGCWIQQEQGYDTPPSGC